MRKTCKETFYLIVTGSSTFNDYELLKARLDHLLSNKMKTHYVTIISGGDQGADKLGEKYALENGLGLKVLEADWNGKGIYAGYLRNVEMAKIANAVVVFWDSQSKGPKPMIDIAREKNLAVRIVQF